MMILKEKNQEETLAQEETTELPAAILIVFDTDAMAHWGKNIGRIDVARAIRFLAREDIRNGSQVDALAIVSLSAIEAYDRGKEAFIHTLHLRSIETISFRRSFPLQGQIGEPSYNAKFIIDQIIERCPNYDYVIFMTNKEDIVYYLPELLEKNPDIGFELAAPENLIPVVLRKSEFFEDFWNLSEPDALAKITFHERN